LIVIKMNIEQFKARVAESAAAAQKAARQLSSLDEMASNDDYIKSPDLNVRTKTKKGMGSESSSSSFSDANSASEIPAVFDDFSARFVDVISKAARPSPSRSGASSAASSKASSPRTQSPTLESTMKKTEIQTTKAMLIHEQNGRKNAQLQPKQKTKQQQQSNKKQLAKAPKANPINEKHAFILQQLDYESDSDSTDSEQSTDTHSQSKNGLHDELEYELKECIAKTVSNIIEKKDPNRFMKMAADLESERDALIANTAPTSKTIAPAHKDCEDGRAGLWGNSSLRGGTAGEETNKALRAGLSWVQNVATPQLNAISQHILTKVADTSRTDNSQSIASGGPIIPSRSKLVTKESDEENITMTTSSTFLSADEIAQFERMQSKTSQSIISAMVLPLVEAIKGNQRLAFVVFTLLLSLFVYYYSRKRSVDDVL
jgi:hypothetical protein